MPDFSKTDFPKSIICYLDSSEYGPRHFDKPNRYKLKYYVSIISLTLGALWLHRRIIDPKISSPV